MLLFRIETVPPVVIDRCYGDEVVITIDDDELFFRFDVIVFSTQSRPFLGENKELPTVKLLKIHSFELIDDSVRLCNRVSPVDR